MPDTPLPGRCNFEFPAVIGRGATRRGDLLHCRRPAAFDDGHCYQHTTEANKAIHRATIQAANEARRAARWPV